MADCKSAQAFRTDYKSLRTRTLTKYYLLIFSSKIFHKNNGLPKT